MNIASHSVITMTQVSLRLRFPWWKIIVQGALGVACAAWAGLHLAGHTYASPRVAAGYAAVTSGYLIADTLMNYRLGTLTRLVIIHHAVMNYFPWAMVAFKSPATMIYLSMCAGSTEIGVALFYIFLRVPQSRAAQLMARFGLLQRTCAVAECARVLLSRQAAASEIKQYRGTAVLLTCILAINQYYTWLFGRKYARVMSGSSGERRAKCGIRKSS